MCQDSSAHQNYTRKWAIELGVPVFSVDYRLSPKHPFPAPVNDCYQAYVWLVTQAKEQLGLNVSKWILAGDSAGGHLAVSTTLLALLRGFRTPDGIFVHYPAFNLSPKVFVPSMLLSLDEELLNQGFLLFACACFTRKGGDPSKNLLVSPKLAPDAMLKRMPPCKFMVAENDCLRDQSFEMCLRMLKLGRQCQIILMKDYIHGFNNMDINYAGIDEYRRGTRITVSHFVRLFNQINQQE